MLSIAPSEDRVSMTRVLVIEDDRRTAAEIAAALGDHGFDVECAYNGRDGLLNIFVPHATACDSQLSRFPVDALSGP